jgi:P4 family phage/plasmid primase-like protien
MDEFKRYLYQFRCEKGQSYTHTSIDKPKVSLHVPKEKAVEFNAAYTKAMVMGCALHLTEKPTDPSPMRADLDYRFMMPENKELKRQYTKDDICRILQHYYEVLSNYLEGPSEAWTAYVMEKPAPTEYRGKIKDGIHIVWPELVVSHTFQHLVRKKVLDTAQAMFSGMTLCNTYEDIIDQAIIDKNNWQMYGSRKPESQAYRVTRVYQYDPSSKSIKELSAPSAEEELRFVSLFSMRHKDKPIVQIKEDKAAEVDEYVRLVLPTMDERKKTKLHTQIFGKSINHTKNFVSDEELALARQLVAECLSSKRAESYEDWIKVGWTLRNIDYRLLDAFKDFSKCSSKYMEGECATLWDKMRIDTLGMGTLRWWARLDNPIKYNEILDSNAMTLIDRCIGSDGAHFDVAKVVHALYKDRYRFTSKDLWYTYKEEKHRWVRTREGLQLRIVLSNEVCSKFMERAMYWSTEAMRLQEGRDILEDKSKKLTSIALKLKQTGYKDSLMKECKCLFTDEKFEELLDSHPHLIGFENGVYDLRMHEFRDGLPDDYISFTTGRHYMPYDASTSEATEIEAFFASVFTNEEVRKFMKDVLACILDGGIRQEKFYIFTGSGSNGKSKILELVQKAIGDYFCILPIALLTQKRVASNSAQSELERTKGRRIAVMQEPGENERLNIGLMKELSGGDRIMCRGLFKEPIEFKPQFKMIMTCNELPEVPSDDGGTWRRIRVVEYTSKFVETPSKTNKKEFPMDPELSDKFDRWADMFISMLIDHHCKIDPKNIHEPLEVRIATEGYKKNNDIIGQYIGEKMVADEDSTERILLNKVYTDFKVWAYQAVQKGKKIPDRNQFRAYMEKQFGAYPSDGKGWRGVRYLSADTAEEDVE